LGYTTKIEVAKNIGFYLMDYYNWRRPHQSNKGVPRAKAEIQPKILAGIICPLQCNGAPRQSNIRKIIRTKIARATKPD
jgi:hypothetical protein